jgi:hypothetical protein
MQSVWKLGDALDNLSAPSEEHTPMHIEFPAVHIKALASKYTPAVLVRVVFYVVFLPPPSQRWDESEQSEKGVDTECVHG